MTLRANYLELVPAAINILMNQENYLHEQFDASETLSITVWELVKLRVSQINQCAFCIDMHSKYALSRGETSERLIGLSAWRDSLLYTSIEMAALDWAELMTSGKPIGDRHYQYASKTLGDDALINLTIAINAINSWNRLSKAFKPEVVSDQQG